MITLALLLAAATPAPPAVSLYGDRFYRGPADVFTTDQPRLPRAIAPESLKIVGRWELCADRDYKGQCMEIDRDYPVAAGLGQGFSVRSLRQLATGDGVARPTPSVTPGGPSLGGVASRYWAAPTYGNERVLACPRGKANLNCAHDTAEELCRRAGYRVVRYWQLQTVDARVYLADILCTRSDEK
ncbi:hypothetical protein [Polymorphobacter fuscus]|uniref:Beta/gamma crystallin 'Greek key' domain-containing protein n=1 Tax=Sandarakinorhabdus fusca TaxID=1439888 RepID=A0A7C9GVA8_9SPHN|nr:hypothetical protein [Polymorphobacter fuscus]KAB7647878.1 hypothetical protein F9290_07925 [Polymorphobacter fuscus]MQT17189.1 hypothetical protein [Polymorphobacter fuscus]NJC08817.1 hypothetical protein [Polymorphobacter fuscus]